MDADTILVTGASGGIGAAVARAFAGHGARLALHCHRGRERADALAATLGPARCRVMPADLSTPAGCDGLLAQLSEWAPEGMTGLVHAAGGTRDGLAINLPESAWDEVIGAHLSAPWRLLKAGGVRPGGFVVLIGSSAGRFGRGGQAAYAAAKAGLAGLSRALARPLGSHGVRINTVIPGPVDTPMWRALDWAARQAILATNAVERINTPDEVAHFVVVLSRMRATSGQVLAIGSRLEGGL